MGTVYELSGLTWDAFVGRAGELALLGKALETALQGSGSLVFLAGEPGIGKTRLAQEFARAAATSRVHVLWGRCEADLTYPYRPFLELARQSLACHPPEAVGQALEQLLRVLGGSPFEPGWDGTWSTPRSRSTAERQRDVLLESAAAALTGITESMPLLLVLDDLQHADTPSLLLLTRLARRLHDRRLLIVATYRNPDPDRRPTLAGLLREMRREGLARRIHLQGLASDEVTALLESVAGQGLDESGRSLALALYQQTEGNPLFVLEALRHLVETGRVYRDGGRWRSDVRSLADLSIPEEVREVIEQRLALLSGACRHVLGCASILGHEFEFTVLVRMADLTEDAVLEAVEEALDAQIIMERRDRPLPTYAFRHFLIWQLLYGRFSLPRRQRLHLQAAQAIQAVHQPRIRDYLAELARHYRSAEPGVDPAAAADVYTAAGELAWETAAYEDAVAYLKAALALLEEHGADPGRQAGLLERLARFLYLTESDRSLCLQYAEQAVLRYQHVGDEARAARARSWLVWVLASATEMMDLQRASIQFRTAEAVLSRHDDTVSVGYLYVGQAGTALWCINTGEGLAASARAMSIADRHEKPTLWSVAAAIRGWHLAAAGQVREGLELMERSWEVASHVSHVAWSFRAAWNRGVWSLLLAHARDAQAWLERELLAQYLDQTPILRRSLLSRLAMAAVHAGDTAGARRLLAEIGPEGGVQALLAFVDGDWEGAERGWRQAHDKAYRAGNRFEQLLTALHLADLARVQGHYERAVELALEAVGISVDGNAPAFEALARVCLGRVFAALNRAADARQQLSRCRAIVRGEAWQGMAGHLSLLEADVATSERDWGAAWQAFSRARQAFARYAMPLLEAEVLLTWGLSLDAAGEPGADARVERARELYLRHGVGRRWQQRAEDLRQRSRDRARGPANPAGLSAREMDVLRLLAAGMTNREIAGTLIISPNTVARHVSNILAKVGAANRTEAAILATRFGLVSDGRPTSAPTSPLPHDVASA